MTFTLKAFLAATILICQVESREISDGGVSLSATVKNSTKNIIDWSVTTDRVLFSSRQFDGDLWSLDLVDSSTDGAKRVVPDSCVSASVENVEKDKMDLVWHSCGQHEVDVILHAIVGGDVTLGGRPSGSLRLSLRNAPEDVGVYKVGISLPLNANKTMSESDSLFVPDSFGVQAVDPLVSMPQWSGTYPSAGCSMQFFGYGNADGSCYLGVHDKSAVWKQLSWSNGVFSFLLTPEDATLKLTGGVWDQGFPIVFADLQTGVGETTPLWYTASAAYRDFVLDEQDPAPWVGKGSIGARIPDYLKESDVWINTGWQCVDIFEPQQGDPSTVYDRVTPVAKNWRSKGLKSPIALHYYEWQQGPDEGEESRFKFDTHYPDYFPGRVSESGEGLESVSKKLLDESDVYVYPYINGRIFDLNSTSFLEDDGEQYCVKTPSDQVKLFDPNNKYDLVTTTESYGSGPTFCVANAEGQPLQQSVLEGKGAPRADVDAVIKNDGGGCQGVRRGLKVVGLVEIRHVENVRVDDSHVGDVDSLRRDCRLEGGDAALGEGEGLEIALHAMREARRPPEHRAHRRQVT